MKLLDILLENTIEYRVKFTTIIDRDVSQGSASYKDLDDAQKFFDGLKRDPEVYRAELEKVMGADSSRDMAGASFVGGTEGIERYSNPATKGKDQGGKDIKDLTGISNLKNFMKDKGFNDKLIEKIFFKNWIDFLDNNLIK